MRDLTGYQCDDELAAPSLNSLGWSVTLQPWDDPSVEWSRYQLVVVRSTWDYQDRMEQFLSTLRTIDQSEAVLANPLETLEWNINKRYLSELSARGVDVVPTVWGRAGDLPEAGDLFSQLGCEEIVLKRVVGAGAQDAYRLRQDSACGIWGEVKTTYADHDWMVQPFLHAVTEEGELSLFYFNGEFSHAIRKVPQAGDYRVQEEHGGSLTRVEPDAELREVADAVMAQAPDGLLYARVDLICGATGQYQLMELELIEPALYFRLDESAPGKFARSLDGWWKSRKLQSCD